MKYLLYLGIEWDYYYYYYFALNSIIPLCHEIGRLEDSTFTLKRISGFNKIHTIALKLMIVITQEVDIFTGEGFTS